MMRVIAIMAGKDQRAGTLWMPELPMRTLPAGNEDEANPLKIGNQLANLAWHIQHSATALGLCQYRRRKSLGKDGY